VRMQASNGWALLFLCASAVVAQPQPAPTPRPAPTAPSGTVNNAPGMGYPGSTSPFPDTNTLGDRPIFLSGKVVLSDGSPLSDRVKIERVCNGVPRVETYADRKGRFSFEVGRSLELPDASSASGAPDLAGMPRSRGRASPVDRSLFGCELRAAMPGFRSDEIPLSTVQYMDNPDLGTIILHPLVKMDGLTVSVNSALAPKDARKAYEKAHEALLRKDAAEAQKNFEKAVALYPKYSSAWYELGVVNEQGNRVEAARTNFQQAIAAEPKFLQPYARLAWLWLRDSKWQELADETGDWLKLDPANSPEAYYLSSVASLQLQHFDVSEQHARQAIKLDPAGKNKRAHYVLGLALAQQHKFADSANSLRSFLAAAPEAKDAPMIRQQLSQVEEAAKQEAEAAPPQ
jgi:tetratricopeptide (TPR) repeat protein